MAHKFFTMSFDDGTVYDRRFIEILNGYGIKCTINLNSGLFGMSDLLEWDRFSVMHTKIEADEVAELYKGHEVAVHTVNHPNLLQCDAERVLHEVEEDRKSLSKLCGYDVRGMAYPGGNLYNDEIIDILDKKTGVEYSRTVRETLNFEFPQNWFTWDPTIYHGSALLTETAQRFIDEPCDQDKLFYVWGHSYEFEAWDSWKVIEDFCKMIGGRSDITYATSIEIKDYICGDNK